MTAGLYWFVFIGGAVFLYVIFAPRILPKGRVGRGRSRGGVMDTIARWVVLGLGRLTIAALRGFTKLGVDMATVDETLASWTTWSQDIKAQLKAARDEAQTLRDTDAAEDAAQANALSESLAAKIQAAYETATSSPAETDPETAPGPVAEPIDPSTPVEADPVTPTNPEDPSVPAEDAPEVPPLNEPIGEQPVNEPIQVVDVPSDAPEAEDRPVKE